MQQRNRSPLYYLQPPFKPYAEWIRVPEEAKDAIEYPAGEDQLGDAKWLADLIVKLGPRYGGILPLAAIYLEQQIERGVLNIAASETPDHYKELPLAEMAADISDPQHIAEMRERYPEAELPAEVSLITDDAAAFHVHSLHAAGYLILDDDHVLNMAVPPKKPGGPWHLNGHGDVSG